MPQIGRSAAGKMHLSATVFCKPCDMLVELGTNDCPHAIGMHKEREQIASELLELARAFESYLTDDSRSERRRQQCLAEVRAVISRQR